MHPVTEICEMFRGLAAPWAVCGGWAIELWLGRPVRGHGDVDVAVFRRDQDLVRAHLEGRGWRLAVARDGREEPWARGIRLELPDHAVWCRHADDPDRRFEVLLNERTEDEFIFRRDPAIRMPIDRAMRETGSGVPVLAPAIVLLYKSKRPGPADEADFAAAIGSLEDDDRVRLRRGLLRLSPDHPWLGRLPG